MSIEVSFPSRAAAVRAYSEAFTKAQRIEKRRGIVERAGKVGDAFKLLLALGSAMAELDPTGGAKVAFALCTQAWEYLEQQEKQNESLNELVESIAEMIPSIDSVKGITDSNLSQTVIAMLNLIEDVSLFILSYKPRGSLGKQTMWHAAVSSEDQERTKELVAKFSTLQKVFDRRVSVQTMRTLEIERVYAKLKPTDLAGYNSDRQCIEGTRLDLIDQLVDWTQKSNVSSHLAWVHGPAGFGKSSIATSLCLRLNDRRILASSFFCKRDSPELRGPRQVLTTIACGLARRWEPYRNAVTAAVREDPELQSQHLQPLHDALLHEPLRAASAENQPAGVLVVVVDALDECGDTVARRQLLTCLLDLSQLVSWLRILVTSRPDPDIQEFFERTEPERYTWFDITKHDASADIRVFVQGYLGGMTQAKGWPRDAIDQVSTRANGLFIWARTACKFIMDGFDRRKRLDQVLSGSGLADIDLLYATAIKSGMLDAGKDNMDFMLQCLGAVAVTAQRSPLSVANLALLLQDRVSEDVLERVVDSLSSVLYVDRNLGDAIRIFHPSFMDFIVNQSRSKELCVDLERQNTLLAECCFGVMADGLTFNICGLETSDRFNSDVRDLDGRVQAAIRPHLSYSCLYWSSHFTEAQPNQLETYLREFLVGQKLLYWIEALSLLGKLGTAPGYRTVANDAYRFVLLFYDAISRSTPHLYVSALAFAPRNSGITRRLRGNFPKLSSITEGAEKDWTPCLRSIWVSSETHSTAYSPDSRRIVSGSKDGAVRIWDAETGDVGLGPLMGHSGAVNSVAFSPDGRWIVSGAGDMTIRLWDAETGKARGEPLRGHTDGVLSVAFSPDGYRLVSSSADKTVCVWDVGTGDSILELRGHSDHVWSVAFSPDGYRIASGSNDRTLRIWDAKTGAPVLEPLLDHSGPVNCVAFSPDGHKIVSGSGDRTVRVWDAKTGKALLNPLRGHSERVWSVMFSPNSRLIASGAWDKTVRIWDARTGAAISQPLDSHSGWVRSVAFSPGGRRVVSGSYDKAIRIWDITGEGTSGMAQGSTSHKGHSHYVNSVAFSSNGKRVVSGSDDRTVCIWDAETGAMALGPLGDYTSTVQAIAFSSDDRRIASGYEDGTLQIWDSETGMPVLDPLRGHSKSVASVAFSPDCRLIASGSDDNTIRFWDAETGCAVLQPLTDHLDWVTSVSFSADGCRIVSGSTDKTVRIWDVETGQAVLEPLTGHSDCVKSVAFSSDGRWVMSGSDDQTVRIWDAETGNPVHDPLRGHTDWVRSVAFSPDSRWIVSGSDDNTVRIWDAETGNAVPEPLLGHSGLVMSVAFSSDGRHIVSGSCDMTIRLWDVEPHTRSSDKTPRFLPGMSKSLFIAVYSRFVTFPQVPGFQLSTRIRWAIKC
ncbi:hypothetical protein FRC09_020676 [Ceratobasidium sp. 395]|nr:hypothetical protein FRC09_020676 [Ceratobasidium sp. 395]